MDNNNRITHFIGIDNGVTGSIAILSFQNKKLIYSDYQKIPTYTSEETGTALDKYTYIHTNNLCRYFYERFRDIFATTNQIAYVNVERPMINPLRFTGSISAAMAYISTRHIIFNVFEDLSIGLNYNVIDSKPWQAWLRKKMKIRKKNPDMKKLSTEFAKQKLALIGNNLPFEPADGDGFCIAYWAAEQAGFIK